jgi:tRNA/rRNA methyltransferase
VRQAPGFHVTTPFFVSQDDPLSDLLNNVRIVLCETSHPGNIGAAARAMKTMGLARLHLVKPERFPDDEARWRAAHALDVLAEAHVHASLDEALEGVAFAVACTARTRDISVPAVTAAEGAARAIEVARVQEAALVFGNETYGLTNDDVNKCRLLASIPANPRCSSLNLAAAVQVFAYELRLAALAGTEGVAQARLATHEQVEALYQHLETIMAEVGFLDPEHPKKLMPRLRRLFSRAALEPEEVNLLRGILKALANPRRK